MAQGNVVDVKAMGDAGFSSRKKAEDLHKKRQREFWQNTTNAVYSALGNAAIGQVKQSFRNLQDYRNKSDSQTAFLNLKLDKMPKDNPYLEASVIELNTLYR